MPTAAGCICKVKLDGRAKSWIFRYAVDGRERSMGLGPLDTIGLARARELARECREQRLNGIDPLEARKTARLEWKLAQAKEAPFRQCCEGWMTTQEPTWTADYLRTTRQRFERHVYPKLGDLPVQKLAMGPSSNAVALIHEVLKPIWLTITPTAMLIQQQIEGALNWARAQQYITGDNAASLKGPLGILLPKPEAFYTVEHHPSLPYQEIGHFMATLRAQPNEIRKGKPINTAQRDRVRELRAELQARLGSDYGVQRRIAKELGLSQARICKIEKDMREDQERKDLGPRRPGAAELLEFVILTAVRVGQARNARWREFDLEKGIWSCPHHKTAKKTKVDYVVPLSKQALAILERMKEKQRAEGIETEWVFLGKETRGGRGRGPMYDTAPIEFLKKILGRTDISVHGFRSTFKAWSVEHGYEETDSEMALGHIIGEKVRNIYARHAQKIEPRRVMMQDWSNYCDRTEPLAGDVVQFRQAKKGETA